MSIRSCSSKYSQVQLFKIIIFSFCIIVDPRFYTKLIFDDWWHNIADYMTQTAVNIYKSRTIYAHCSWNSAGHSRLVLIIQWLMTVCVYECTFTTILPVIRASKICVCDCMHACMHTITVTLTPGQTGDKPKSESHSTGCPRGQPGNSNHSPPA